MRVGLRIEEPEVRAFLVVAGELGGRAHMRRKGLARCIYRAKWLVLILTKRREREANEPGCKCRQRSPS